MSTQWFDHDTCPMSFPLTVRKNYHESSLTTDIYHIDFIYNTSAVSFSSSLNYRLHLRNRDSP